VATVGRMEVAPGAVNVIPSGARFTLDIRSPEDAVRRDAVASLERELREIALRRGITVQLRKSYEEAAAACAGWLTGQLEAAVARLGVRPLRLPSGAGHDGLAMAALCPIAMLFVRCKGGISHNPAESITPEDADVAVRVLVDFLRHFQPQPH
jgi:allantoate deiminase